MARWKRWALLLAISGPMATTYSCGTLLAQGLRDAAIDGAAGFVQASTNDLLDRLFGPDAQAP
ncbi:MAG: hypothetical protein Q7R41_18130 [Phycisphaerales bacterium]|nr:hypothetical protein [Phycisphaerales bacterium]